MTTPTPDAAAALQAANARADRYLAALWEQSWFWATFYSDGAWSTEETCRFCLCHDPDKAAVVHAPGCVFFDLDAATVAALDADWTPT